MALVAAAMTRSPVELAAEPVYDDVAWCSAYDLDPFEVPLAEKAALLEDWTRGLLASDAVEHGSAWLQQVHENKFYADLAGTTTTQQRVRLQPFVEAYGSRGDRFDSMATIAPPVGRGWEYLRGGADGWDFDAELAQIPDLLAEKLRGPQRCRGSVRPGHRSVEPLAHDPRVDRPRDRARPCARLRSQLRRHVLRHARSARRAAVRLAPDARHRGPHHRPRAGHDRVRRRGRRGAVLGHHPRRRARRLPARPVDGALLRCGPQRRTVQRMRVRRLPRPHPGPAHGERLAAARSRRSRHRGADLAGRARGLRRG